MLSDEEKEAIDLLKNIDKQKCMMLECPVVKNNIERQLKIIELNRTIRKQSKEIEEYKKQLDLDYVDKHFVPIERYNQLKKEIEELKEYKHDAELTKVACCTAQNCEALNNCIKLERELQNADKVWEDKIKAKIEELKEDIKYSANPLSIDNSKFGIKVLQSLLEKE